MIKNKAELDIFLKTKMQVIIENVAIRLTNELINIIDEEVYSYNNTFYERTFQFKNSWEYSKPMIVGNIIQSQIFQNYTTMVYDSEKWQHGSKYEKWGQLDVGGLNEIINNGDIGKIANFPQLGARPFWDKFQEYVNQNITKIFIEECNKNGLVVSKGVSSIFK